MPVDEEFHALGGLEGVDFGGQSLGLGGVASSGALEVLGAGVGGSAAGDLPFVGPVTVDVVSQTGASGGGLSVLAP